MPREQHSIPRTTPQKQYTRADADAGGVTAPRGATPYGGRNLVYIEFLRIIAIFLVVFEHTNEYGAYFYTKVWDSPLVVFYMFISIFQNINVPVFFMLSGALLLGREESFKTLFRKRILKFTLILLIVSVLYYFYYADGYGRHDGYTFAGLSLAGFADRFLTSVHSPALWYLYAYIGFLLMLPLLRRLVRVMRDRHYFYLTALYILFTGVLPVLQYLISKNDIELNQYFSAHLITADNIFYPLMGYYLGAVLKDKHFSRKNLFIGIAASLAAITVTALMTYYRYKLYGQEPGELSQLFHNCFIAIPAFTMFFAAKRFFMKRRVSPRVGRAVVFLGGTTFGVFLLEGMLRRETFFIFSYLEPRIHVFPACVVWIVSACVLGSLLTALLKLIPGLRKVL